LDLEHTAMMGHSFGGSTTVTALADDKRFRYAINAVVPCYLSRSKGFTTVYSYWLVVIPCLADICKGVYIVVHVRTDCGI